MLGAGAYHFPELGVETAEEDGFVLVADVVYYNMLDAVCAEAHVAGGPTAEPELGVHALAAPLSAEGAQEVAGVDAAVDLGDGGALVYVGDVVGVARVVAEFDEQGAQHGLQGLGKTQANEAVLRDEVVGDCGFATLWHRRVDSNEHG